MTSTEQRIDPESFGPTLDATVDKLCRKIAKYEAEGMARRSEMRVRRNPDGTWRASITMGPSIFTPNE